MLSTRLEVNLALLARNARVLRMRYGARGIRITAVTKGVCGSPQIARALLRGGIRSFGDARLANIVRMREAGIRGEFMLIRPPRPSQADRVVSLADISLNTELDVIQRLSWHAEKQGRTHGIILMIELGDLREGIMPERVAETVEALLAFSGVRLLGLGTNLACLNGVVPTAAKMRRLSDEVGRIEARLGLCLPIVSGGNSANHDWVMSGADVGRINHLRIGEALLLGKETVNRRPIEGLAGDAFALVGEVVEAKTKPSRPDGERGQNAFGQVPSVADNGLMRRAIVALGAQDIDPAAIHPCCRARVIGACSDELVLIDPDNALVVGSSVRFSIEYSALLRAMTSSYVHKLYHPPQALQRPKPVKETARLDGAIPPNRRDRVVRGHDQTA